MYKSIETAPKDGTRILVDEGDNEPYITSWINDVYTAQGGKGGPSGWFSYRYSDHWGDRPEFDEPKFWIEIPLNILDTRR